MKAVIADLDHLSPALLEERRRRGLDIYDEMWNGVLHVPPMPNREQQDIESAFETWLRYHWAPRREGARAFHQINLTRADNVDDWTKDFRIPDVLLLTADRDWIDHNEFFAGPPLVVVEIHSPNDEAYEKLPFYAEVGVPGAWIIERDSRRPEIHVLTEGVYVQQSPGKDGWLTSPAAGIDLRRDRNRLGIRLTNNHSVDGLLP